MPLDEAEGTLEYCSNQLPKCPWCDHDYDVSGNEDWELYEDGTHEIECPSCGKDYSVDTFTSCTFDTDDQGDYS